MSLALSKIIELLDSPEVWGNPLSPVEGVTHDSRRVGHNYAFVAIKGDKSDGHDFVHKAAERGASVIIAQNRPPENFDITKSAWVCVSDSRRILGPVADLVYGHPSQRLVLIGITGTNGKTTTTYLLESILKAANFVPGIVGTISHRWPGFETPAFNTTPEAPDIQNMLAEMKLSGVSHVIMEVSSHGLSMRRLDGCSFDVGLFTNLTHDHLDFHHDMESYYRAKKILFDDLLPSSKKMGAFALINLDDQYGSKLVAEIIGIPVFTYGFQKNADIRTINQEISVSGIKADIVTPNGVLPIESHLTGTFNLSNILSAVGVCVKLQIPRKAIIQGIKSLENVPGRLQRVPCEFGSVFVDYAHTPNALRNVLQALRRISEGRLITLMGCGGDRDWTKRPVMGSEAAGESDFIVITSDNPRSEDPLIIIDQIENGVTRSGFKKILNDSNSSGISEKSYVVIPDRRKAIEWVISKMKFKDTLLLAGKGHEAYQEIKGIRHPFDDRSVALEIINRLKLGDRDNLYMDSGKIEQRA